MGALPGLPVATFSLMEREGEISGVPSSSYKDTNAIMGAPPSCPHPN